VKSFKGSKQFTFVWYWLIPRLDTIQSYLIGHGLGAHEGYGITHRSGRGA